MTRRTAVPCLVLIALALVAPLANPATATAATAATAEAETPFTVRIDSPGSGETFSRSSSASVSGRVSAALGASVTGITVQVVRSSDGSVVFIDSTACCATPQSGEVSFGPVKTSSLGRNGPYHVVVTATGYYDFLLSRTEAAPGKATSTFTVAVAPAAPTNVRVQVLPDRKVEVSWDGVPSYDDFIGYAVYRKSNAGPFVPVGATGQRSYTDTPPTDAVGAIQYQVASVRQGAVPGNDPDQWLVSKSDAVVATLPAVPTTPPAGGGGTTTTTPPPGGGLQQGGPASSDLGSFFSTVPNVSVPSQGPPSTLGLPDTGYLETLPFPASTEQGKLQGRQPGRPAGSSGSGDLEELGTEDQGNRRALLVPVAAGSVLCVAALHLRWLNRRLAIDAMGAAGPGHGGPGPGGPDGGSGVGYGPDGGELEHADLDDDAFLPHPEPVGAGRR